MKFLKRLYMKTHGFTREESPFIGWACWHRKGHENSTDPENMIMEIILYELSWNEIIKRYRK